MPNHWEGTIEQRFERLERYGRRCDANSRHCTRGAVDEYDMLPADGDFHPLPGAEIVVKKSCAYHRVQFLQNGRWVVQAKRDLARREPTRRREPAPCHRADDSDSAPARPATRERTADPLMPMFVQP